MNKLIPPSEVSSSALSGAAPPVRTDGGPPHAHNFQDLTGRRFGLLVVLSLLGRKNSSTFWACRCACGKKCSVMSHNLIRGHTKSCGCLKFRRIHKSPRFCDLVGKKFNRLTVLKFHGVRGHRMFWCTECECGTRKIVEAGCLKSGNTSSCGCLQKEKTHARCYNPSLSLEHRARRRLDKQGINRLWNLIQLVFARDSYTCLACGERGGRLAAHHIMPWALYPDLRHNKNNLVTLCKDCHKQFHDIYGHDCDLDDLEEYLK